MSKYLIFWWLQNDCYYALFDDEDEADSAAGVRNALKLEIGSLDGIPLDYYRRDESGTPKPAIRRNLKASVPRPKPPRS